MACCLRPASWPKYRAIFRAPSRIDTMPAAGCDSQLHGRQRYGGAQRQPCISPAVCDSWHGLRGRTGSLLCLSVASTSQYQEQACQVNKEQRQLLAHRKSAPFHAGGAGAAAAAAAAGRRCRKVPPPATLPLLGAKGNTPYCRKHFFMAATCLSHALNGSRPFELTTRCGERRSRAEREQ